MKRGLLSIAVGVALLAVRAHADLCDNVKDLIVTQETLRDIRFYEELFKYPSDGLGSSAWNELVLQCNRKRDTKGNDVRKVLGTELETPEKKTLRSSNLEAKVIRGHYNFFGQLVAQLKYVYVLSKANGVWTMVIPYRPVINELVENRVDFDMGWRDINEKTGVIAPSSEVGHAWQLYDRSQVATVTDPVSGKPILALKTDARPIAETLCSTTTFFEGKEDKYDGQNDEKSFKRDPENKFISLGKIQYRYKDHQFLREGCRVSEERDVFWVDPDTDRVVQFKPQDFVLDNFVRVAESYWSIPKAFELKLFMKGRNDEEFSDHVRELLKDGDHLTVRFATKFLPYQYNQMYKSNIIQFNNFSTMTSDGTYRHEVGHAFGLDDEYAGEKHDETPKKNGCENENYKDFQPTTYQMCAAGVSEVRTIYHYIAVSRYVTKQSECNGDGDCGAFEYCDKGTISIGKNQCVAKKADNDTCDVAGGGWQCRSGHCKFSRCYTPASVPMGGTCYNDDACAQGKCTAVDGAKGECVCKKDGDCGPGMWCDGGLDTKTNKCRAKLNKGEKCGKAGSVGNDHKCKSDKCSGFPNYECK